MGDIYLSDIFNDLGNLKDYKLHFARRSDTEPLDEYVSDFDSWKGWNTYSKSKNEFNRKYIFSLINFYPEKDTWLFGGIWEVIETDMSKIPVPYKIKLCEKYYSYIGRLKVKYPYKDRTTRPNLENHFEKLILKEILEEPYSINVFPGYKNIDLPFTVIETIIRKDATEWKNALRIKGIYLLTDVKSGKRYVGKADGENGLWQRWSDYISDGHGGDVDLKCLVESKGFDYVRQNFKFAILETISGWDENNIDERESHWKMVLLSRHEDFGHNKN